MTPQQLALFWQAVFAGPSSMNPMFKFWLDLYTAPLLNNPRENDTGHGRESTKIPKQLSPANRH